MLTPKQYDLLLYIHQTVRKTGVAPSFDEMKEALELKSKSGIHRLISALEERGYLRKLPNKARALEILRLPENMTETMAGHADAGALQGTGSPTVFTPRIVKGDGAQQAQNGAHIVDAHAGDQQTSPRTAEGMTEISVLGRIAAGTPISAIEHEQDRLPVPSAMLRAGDHFALKVQGDSMIDKGILDDDLVLIQRCAEARNGEIVVALVDEEEATLKILRKKGKSVALEAANPAFETRIFGPGRVRVQGRLIGLIRHY